MVAVMYRDDPKEIEDASRDYALAFFGIGVGLALAEIFRWGFFGVVGTALLEMCRSQLTSDNAARLILSRFPAENLTRRLRSMSFRAIVRQDVAYFDEQTHNSYVLNTRLQTDTGVVHAAATQVIDKANLCSPMKLLRFSVHVAHVR